MGRCDTTVLTAIVKRGSLFVQGREDHNETIQSLLDRVKLRAIMQRRHTMPEDWWQPLTDGRNRALWNWCKNWQNGRQQAKPRLGHAQRWFGMENSRDDVRLKRLASPTPSTGHAQWNFQSLGIKAASNDALPLTPNQTSPCTHRSYHLGSITLPSLFGFWSLILSYRTLSQ